jgi:hypothetical protein
MEIGPWNKQGYPLYGEGVSYKQRFKVAETKGRHFVQLAEWEGSVAKVIVNGKDAGYVWHQPWQCDVTGQVKKGNNEIEVVVIGTLKNTLGPHHIKPSLGEVSPRIFREVPSKGPPPGNKYHTVGYGLTEPFKFLRSQ